MDVSDNEMDQAKSRMAALREEGFATAARLDRRTSRILIELSTGVQLAVPIARVEGLAGAAHDDLDEIEISAGGLGLHWPRLDADVYVPALLKGVFGSRRWMAAEMGAIGGKSTSAAKASSARANGRKGGRPRKVA